MQIETTKTANQIHDVKRLVDILENIQPEKRYIVTIAAEAFASGMNAQERSEACSGSDKKTLPQPRV